jgi:ribosomal protein S18 acetylase RimI-like enzyme
MLAPDGYGYLPIPEVDAAVLQTFCCGKPHLNAFLIEQALALHQHRLGLTHVVFHRDWEGVVAYFTLQNDGIPLEDFERMELGYVDNINLPSFPAVKIGRLAVTQALQGQGVGTRVLELIIGELLRTSSLSAARLLVVDADNDDEVVAFYRKQGFVHSLWAQNQLKNHRKKNMRPATIKMLLDVHLRLQSV